MRKCFKFFCHRSLSSLLCDSVAVNNVLNTVIVMADFVLISLKVQVWLYSRERTQIVLEEQQCWCHQFFIRHPVHYNNHKSMETLHYLSDSNSLYLHCFMHGILMMSRAITKGRGLEISPSYCELDPRRFSWERKGKYRRTPVARTWITQTPRQLKLSLISLGFHPTFQLFSLG